MVGVVEERGKGHAGGRGETCPGGAKEVAILAGQYAEEGLGTRSHTA